MDYGPFGFMQRFKQGWNMWQGSGEHFGLINQPMAPYKNYMSFIDSIKYSLNINIELSEEQ